MKRLLLPFFLLAFAFSAMAQSPKEFPMTGTQPTGELLTIYKAGNGSLALYATIDGYAVLHEADGGYYYARITSKGLEASTQLAHDPSARDAAEQAFVQRNAITEAEAFASPSVHRSPLKSAARTSYGLGEYGKSANGTVPSIGTITIPVIMVEFTDRAFQATSTIEKMTRFLNEEGYSDEANTAGSVRDYFLAQSSGMFQPTFNVVAKVKASKNYAYYGGNSSSSRDTNLQVLIKEAIDSAIGSGVDFSTMLVSGNIPLVTVIFAGPGEHNSFEDGQEDYIWAQFNTFTYKSSLGGPTFKSFFVGDEIMQSYNVTKEGDIYIYNVTGSRFEGMGVFCHEFGHALGLPDFYNAVSGGGVVDYWSVMDYGQYWKNGYRPIGYNAYERNFLGWIKINDLDNNQQVVTIYPIGSADNKEQQAYRIVNPANEREYYIFENRQTDTWYPAELGTGLLVYHVDYNATSWSTNKVNTIANHPRFQVLPADSKNQVYSTLRNEGKTAAQAYEQFQGDVFPGTTGTSSIATFPVYTGSTIAAPCYNVAVNSDKTITLQYLDLPQPAGKFVRIKSQANGLYVGAAATAQPLVSDANQAGVYYVTSDNRLTAFQQGLFLSAAEGLPCADYAADGATFGFDVSVVTNGATAGTYSIQNDSEGTFLKATSEGLTVSADGNEAACEFVLEEVTEIPMTLNTATGYATLVMPVPFSVSSDVTVLYPSLAHDNLLTISETGFNSVADNVPVMLYKEGGGNITISVAANGQTIDGNLLTATSLGGTLVPAAQKAYVYALTDQGNDGCFRLLSDTDRGIAGFRAYYVAEAGGSAPQYLYFNDGPATSIENVMINAANAELYDLQGRRVERSGQIPAGIYILKSGKRSQKVSIR